MTLGISGVAALVAPHAGARIETVKIILVFRQFKVAPHAGARIETTMTSPFRDDATVAPHAGARIET